MPITVLMVLSGLFMLFFYNSVMGLPSVLVGIGLAASLVLDALLDPYIGHISDRTNHGFGRRHVFMLPGA
ncbi:MAG: MFS transporter, partial [Bryobacteraceae bacterium]